MRELTPNRTDIGALIKHHVDLQRWSYTDFARAINCSRSSLYNIFNSHDISLLRLIRICRVLDVDLIDEILSSGSDTRLPERPQLTIPLNSDGADLSQLPANVIELLEKALEAFNKPT